MSSKSSSRSFLSIQACRTSRTISFFFWHKVAGLALLEYVLTSTRDHHLFIFIPYPVHSTRDTTRAKELNTIPNYGHWELEKVWNWMNSNPDILVGLLTGSGRAFCTGADLRGERFPLIIQSHEAIHERLGVIDLALTRLSKEWIKTPKKQ